MLIQLRRKIFPNNTGTGAPFVAQIAYYDTEARKPYPTQLDSQLNDPAELAKDAVVNIYDYRPGKSRVVYYDGNGSVYTKNFPPVNPGAGINDVKVKLGLAPFYTSGPGTTDAAVDLTGQFGLPPYQTTLVGMSGAALGYVHTDPSPSELFPVRVYNLPLGYYIATVTDTLGHSASLGFTITAGPNQARGVLLARHGYTDYIWSYEGHNIQPYAAAAGQDDYYLPTGSLVDGFFLVGLTVWRNVYSNGKGGVYFDDFTIGEQSTLALENLILFHPDTAAEQNGGLVVEVQASHPPLSFQLTGTTAAGPVAQANATGLFDGLSAGTYSVLVTDQLGKALTVPVELKLRYGKHWVLEYSEVSGVPMRLELWTLGYTGTVEPLKGQAHPVVIKTDGLNSTIGGQGDIGPVVGTSAELSLRVTPEDFEEIIGRDRYCRADYYYNNQLYFRGFVQPDTFDAPMLPGLQPLNIIATDGLGALKELYMTGEVGERLYGRRPWLNTLLHCLSRCDVALPLRIFTNRRDATMSDADAPEELATTDRTAYWDDTSNEPWRMRKALEAVVQAQGGTLVQRGGRWEVRNILEAAKPANGRGYLPAGTPVVILPAGAPTATVLPPTQGPLHWLQTSQVKQVRAGWKSLVGTTDAGWLKNAYPQGTVFSDKYAWLDDTSRLRANSGWRPAPGGTFPLVFSRLGEKGGAYTTQWPRSSVLSTLQGQTGDYLQGPPLPLAAGLEAVPAAIQFAGRFVPVEFYPDKDGKLVAAPTNASYAVLPYDLVVDGQSTGIQYVQFKVGASASDEDIVVSAPLPALPTGAHTAELRLYKWFAPDTLAFLKSGNILSKLTYEQGEVVNTIFAPGLPPPYVAHLFVARRHVSETDRSTLDNPTNTTAPDPLAYAPYWYELTPTDMGLGEFYLSSVGVQLTPQGGTWEGADNFRADGVAGTIRPTEALEVVHPDVPLLAGLFGGNLPAFSRGVALADGTMSTSWKRSIDLDASPLFESNVYDGLALRDGASRLLLGTLEHQGQVPPLMLDTLDLPAEEAGIAAHRFAVCATSWNTKLGRTEVSLVQNGASDTAPNPYDAINGNILVTDLLYQYRTGQYVPYALGCEDGSLLSWD